MARRHHANTPAQTRKSEAVRKRHRKQQPPLPFDLQVLPPIKRRMPTHPGCMTDYSAYGGVTLELLHSPLDVLLSGTPLPPGDRFGLYIQGKMVASTNDPQYALAYRYVLREYHSREVQILDNGS